MTASSPALAGAHPGARLATLWSGYGEVVRYHRPDGGTVIAKHVRPPRGRGRGHDRKLRSYEVESTWYREWAPRCQARVAECLAAERADGEWLFVLEDLDAAGFAGRGSRLSDAQLDACLRWLAALHASFLGQRPRGLWKVGTYWHVATRPDEHRAMAAGPLKRAAGAIDARLTAAAHQTLVHGDAKPANFCFGHDAVAAVDFQYVGGGVGVKDVAYLLWGEDRRGTERGLDVYFAELRRRGVEPAVEQEWRALFPWAVADFARFVAGWAPDWRVPQHMARLTVDVLKELG